MGDAWLVLGASSLGVNRLTVMSRVRSLLASCSLKPCGPPVSRVAVVVACPLARGGRSARLRGWVAQASG